MLRLVGLLVLTLACGAGASQQIRLEHGDTRIQVGESGAVVIDSKRVGSVRDRKIEDSSGKPLAFVRDTEIRLRGGKTVPIVVKKDGTTYLPVDPQRDADLRPVEQRIRADGRMAMTEGARGVEIQGAGSVENRRVILALLLLTENDMWQ
jgi:hypothetical protein